MKKLFKITILLTLIASLVITGCSSSKKGQCGCPNKQGMIGYWVIENNVTVIDPPIKLMNNTNRDLLVLFNQELMTPKAIEHEVEQLHEILYSLENLQNIVAAHEAIDVNKYKVFNTPHLLRDIIRQKDLKPFMFLNCKN